jgi:hypothetical protein
LIGQAKAVGMGIKCVGCLDYIRQPDSVWYAGTRFTHFGPFICGTCVSTIPLADRKPIQEERDFEISLGLVQAQSDAQREYQHDGTKYGQALFAVDAKAVWDNIPTAEIFLKQFYPYWCMDWYCVDLLRCRRKERALMHLFYYCKPMRAWLALSDPPRTNIERFEDFALDQQPVAESMAITSKEFSPEESKEMEELLDNVRVWATR